jgi:hypothetical protein
VAAATQAVPAFGHVFLIIGENTDYTHVNTTNAPYLMTKVRPRSAWLENYYAAAHWSQATLALVTGQFNTCQQHDGGIACHHNVDNLYHRMDAAGLSWKVWLGAGTARCDTGAGGSCSSNTACPLSGFYTTGNPPILFDDIEGPNGIWSDHTIKRMPRQRHTGWHAVRWNVQVNAALTTGNVARFNTVIPNGCDDGEANCSPVHNRYTQFDNFLAREVPRIEASSAFGPNGVIIILYDEAQRMGGMAPKNGLGQGGHTVCAISAA